MSNFDTLQKEFTLASKAFDRAVKRLADARKARDKACPHTNSISRSKYHDGGYDYTAYTDYWEECECCGKTFNMMTKNHGWYG